MITNKYSIYEAVSGFLANNVQKCKFKNILTLWVGQLTLEIIIKYNTDRLPFS